MSHFILAHLRIIEPLYEHIWLKIALFTEISNAYLWEFLESFFEKTTKGAEFSKWSTVKDLKVIITLPVRI